MPSVLVRDDRRNGFLATLGTRTWRARAVAAAALADAAALSSRGAYAAWLCRTARAWSRLPVAVAGNAGEWPLSCVGPECLDLRSTLEADLADLCDLAPASAARATGAATHPHPFTDEAFLLGAAYVAVVAATDAGALLGAAESFAAREPGQVGIRFLSSCAELAGRRAPVQRELATWAADRGPDAADRAVLTARTLMLDLAESLRR
jgi:hypothetical protein